MKKAHFPNLRCCRKYARSGAYTDCFHTDILDNVSLPQFVEAFYTTWLFKLERFILQLLVKKPSTDAEAKTGGPGRKRQIRCLVRRGSATSINY